MQFFHLAFPPDPLVQSPEDTFYHPLTIIIYCIQQHILNLENKMSPLLVVNHQKEGVKEKILFSETDVILEKSEKILKVLALSP